MSISKLASSIKTSNSDFPPVHVWNPDLCIGQEITINREGDWLYNKSLIKNTKLVKLFCSVLRNDDGSYYLVTPYEKVPVYPELAPYIITDFDKKDNIITLHTNLNYSFTLNNKNITRLIEYEDTMIPLVHVRSNIEGFFSRATYYKLIDIALKENIIIEDVLHIKSGNGHYPLGKIA
jgi:hypothetical protein